MFEMMKTMLKLTWCN